MIVYKYTYNTYMNIYTYIITSNWILTSKRTCIKRKVESRGKTLSDHEQNNTKQNKNKI